MTILAFLLGLLPLTAGGAAWVAVIEGKTRRLTRLENWTLGFLLGTTGGMFLLFLVLLAGAPLSRLVIAAVILLVAVPPLVWTHLPKNLHRHKAVELAPKGELTGFRRWAAVLIGALSAAKILFLAVTFALVPPFFDDTLSNWNMRAKVFFQQHAFTLTLPNGVTPDLSSYPPTVPLLKAMLATIAGQWNEPLVNSIHILWYIAVLLLLYSTLRRWLPLGWSLLGTYLFASLPFPLLHGTNAYADIFVAAHVFAAVTLLLSAASAGDRDECGSFLRLAAVFGALLPFTKNEGLLIYGGAFFLLFFWLLRKERPARRDVLFSVVAALAVLIPWLAFKWGNGLTFGNAKAVTGLGLTFQPEVLRAVFIHFFFEGNWLLLFPLIVALVVRQWRTVLQWPVSLLSVFLALTVAAQIGIYLLTSLADEAIRQTGFGRGIVQVTPLLVFFVSLLLYQAVTKREE